jgi:hypothetical protein
VRNLLQDLSWTSQGSLAAAHLDAQGGLSKGLAPGEDAQCCGAHQVCLGLASHAAYSGSIPSLILGQGEVQPHPAVAPSVESGKWQRKASSGDGQVVSPLVHRCGQVQGLGPLTPRTEHLQMRQGNSFLLPEGRKGSPGCFSAAALHAHVNTHTCVHTRRHTHASTCTDVCTRHM